MSKDMGVAAGAAPLEQGHTPGPWVWYSEDPSMATLFRKSDDALGVDIEAHVLSLTICKSCQEGDHWRWGRCYTANAADARLIAATPDLLAACKDALHGLRMDAPHREEIETLEAVIAKAEGR